MTRASSDAFGTQVPGAQPSRIIAAEALRGVAAFGLADLGSPRGGAGTGAAPVRALSSRDLANETARAAYAMGRRRGFDQGSALGLQQGYSEGSQALQDFESRKAADVALQMQRLSESFRGEMAALESQVASDLVSLAIDIARQVLRREVLLDANALLPAAREALRALGEGASQVTVQMHPQDAEAIVAHLHATDPQLRIAGNPTLSRGACQIEADTGVADAGFEARWQAVMAGLGRDDEPLP